MGTSESTDYNCINQVILIVPINPYYVYYIVQFVSSGSQYTTLYATGVAVPVLP